MRENCTSGSVRGAPRNWRSYRKSYSVMILSLLIGSIQALGAPSAPPVTERPNFLFLLADDMRWDALGAAGNAIIQTPNLDRLAAQGISFDNAFVTTAICAVSRASIFSGQYARRHGIHDFATSFTASAWSQTYPTHLRAAGYRTGFIGKFGVGANHMAEWFDYWDGFMDQGHYFEPNDATHLSQKMGDSALRFLAGADGRPWALSISFKAPHAQDGAAREFAPDSREELLYQNTTFPEPPTLSEESFRHLPSFVQTSEGRLRWQRRFATPPQRNQTIRDYYRLITGMDREIGRLLQQLEETGMARNTIVLFSSDNGFFLGEHGLADKWLMYEESIRVPLILVDPRQPPRLRGRHINAMALNLDLAPTLLDYAGVPAPQRMQGRSLRPWAEEHPPADWRSDWFYEHHFSTGVSIPASEGVREECWKYIRYTSADPVVEQLVDLCRDPWEQYDLVSDGRYADHLARLRARWAALRDELR